MWIRNTQLALGWGQDKGFPGMKLENFKHLPCFSLPKPWSQTQRKDVSYCCNVWNHCRCNFKPIPQICWQKLPWIMLYWVNIRKLMRFQSYEHQLKDSRKKMLTEYTVTDLKSPKERRKTICLRNHEINMWRREKNSDMSRIKNMDMIRL